MTLLVSTPAREGTEKSDPRDLQEAYRYCRWITEHHYENFPVASWLLPKEKRPFVSAIYAFARSADDFADEKKYKGRSLELLNTWREALKACSNGTPSSPSPLLPQGGEDKGEVGHPIFMALADTIKRCDLPVQLLDDLLTAFTMDVTKQRYANWQELQTYCRYSANPIGRLVLHIFGYRDEELFKLSDFICTGLQLANHWQDLSIDLAKDRLYIPRTLMESHGVEEKELFGMEKKAKEGLSPVFCDLMEELVDRAHVFFDAGEPLLRQVRGRLRWELKLTLLGGRLILNRIEAVNYNVFRHRPVLSVFAKMKLLAYAFAA